MRLAPTKTSTPPFCTSLTLQSDFENGLTVLLTKISVKIKFCACKKAYIFFNLAITQKMTSMNLFNRIEQMPSKVFVVVLPLLAFFLCSPLLYVCLFGGDIPAYKHGLDHILFSLVSILPAIAILLAKKFRFLQVFLFILLLLITGLELTEGITATSQLEHEGSDLAFLMIHAILFAIGMALTLIMYFIQLIKKISNEK